MSGGRGAGPSLSKRQNPPTDQSPCPRASSLAMFFIRSCRNVLARPALEILSAVRRGFELSFANEYTRKCTVSYRRARNS